MELSTRQAEVMDLVKSGMTGYGSAYVPVKYRVTVNSLIKRGLLKVTGVEIAGMITVGLVETAEPEKVAPVEVSEVTSHDFSNHSRRPMQCRLCSRPAEVHATTTDEGSSRAMWTKARKEAGMSTTDAPVKLAAPEVAANPWGPCGPCDGTDAPMARKAHPCGLMTSGSTTVAVFTEAVTAVISEGDTVYRERDGHTGIVVAVNANSLDVEFLDGSERTASPIELFNAGYGVIPAAEVTEGCAAAKVKTYTGDPVPTAVEDICPVCDFGQAGTVHTTPLGHLCAGNPTSWRPADSPIVPPINSGIAHVFVPKPEGFEGGPSFCIAPCHGHVSMPFHMPAESIGTPWRRAECVIWAGTGTLVKPAIRTGLNRRKRKATKRNRARVGGGF